MDARLDPAKSPASVKAMLMRSVTHVEYRDAIYGLISDVATGRLMEVPEATKAGLPA
jgi:hypothetical protein